MRLNPCQPRQQVFTLRHSAFGVRMRMADDALRINQEYRTHVNPALGIEYAIGLADCAMRPVVRQQRKGNTAQ